MIPEHRGLDLCLVETQLVTIPNLQPGIQFEKSLLISDVDSITKQKFLPAKITGVIMYFIFGR